MEQTRKLLTREECATYLGIGLSSLDKLIRDPETRFPYVSLGKIIRIPSDFLEAWITSEAQRAMNGEASRSRYSYKRKKENK